MTILQRELRRALSDAYAFVRSQETNKSVQAVTLSQLLREQIDRNGDPERSLKAQYNPYSYEPGKKEPASSIPAARSNFLSGSDTNAPTKLDRVLAIEASITDLVAGIKKLTLEELEEQDISDTEDGELLTTDQAILGDEATV